MTDYKILTYNLCDNGLSVILPYFGLLISFTPKCCTLEVALAYRHCSPRESLAAMNTAVYYCKIRTKHPIKIGQLTLRLLSTN